MKCVCDHSLLEALRVGEAWAYEWVYQNYYPSVARFVLRNQGTEGDAEDIFQEAVLLLHQKVTSTDFRLTASLKTFLFSMAKNRWLKKLRDERLVVISEEQLMALQETQEVVDAEPTPAEMQAEQLQAWMARITGHCQRVLHSIYFSQEPIDHLMVTMGWKNRHTAVNQKYKCIQQLRRASEIG